MYINTTNGSIKSSANLYTAALTAICMEYFTILATVHRKRLLPQVKSTIHIIYPMDQ